MAVRQYHDAQALGGQQSDGGGGAQVEAAGVVQAQSAAFTCACVSCGGACGGGVGAREESSDGAVAEGIVAKPAVELPLGEYAMPAPSTPTHAAVAVA